MVDYLQILNTNQGIFLADKQYLAEYLSGFYKFYTTEIACVKNTNSQYIAATLNYAKLVGINIQDIIFATDYEIPCFNKSAKIITKHDKTIIRQNTQAIFLDIHEYHIGFGVYMFHTKPILNPHTNNVVGILYNVAKYNTVNLLQTFSCMHNSYTALNNIPLDNPNITLGIKQKEVLACIKLGLKEDKIIAEFINKIKNTHHTPIAVNNTIQQLYKKFNVSNRDRLYQQLLSENYQFTIPRTLIKCGRYPINNSTNYF